MDLDDGHRAAVGHPGAGVIPGVLAACQAHEVPFERASAAIAIGYEVAVRIASSRDIAALTTMVSGPWIGQGVAAAVAYLRGLTAGQMAQAIALAGATAPNLQAVSYSKHMGNHLKEGIPWATATGLSAVDLALAGFTGPIDILDNQDLYRRDALLGGLGEDWALRDVYFKPYSCCRWSHAAMDAALELQAVHQFAADDIKSIDIETFDWALRLNNETEPETLEAAQYSVPFCVALLLTVGAQACLPMSADALSNATAKDLARRVTLIRAGEFDAMFPKAVPARVTIQTVDGHWTHEVLAPLGEPSHPMTGRQMRSKLQRIAALKLGPEDAKRIEEAIDALHGCNLAEFGDELGVPLAVYSSMTRSTG
jgi:2-methylcitrate dehydratase PrpD